MPTVMKKLFAVALVAAFALFAWRSLPSPEQAQAPGAAQATVRGSGVNFVFVNQRESVDRVDAWLKARQLPLRNMLLDVNGQTAAAFKQRALPMTLFFDAKGRLVSTRIGELSSATLTERLAELRR